MPIVVPQLDATIPDGITDLESFRRWAHSDDFPEKGRFAFFNGNVWLDVSMEMAFSHNQVKAAITSTLIALLDEIDLGYFFPDGMLLTNSIVGFSTMPDGTFVSFKSFEEEKVIRRGGTDTDFSEIVGSPDMVLEVISRSSVEKDLEDFMDFYWRAGIDEYWVADGREDLLRFEIYRHGAAGYTAARKLSGGWLKSNVFDRSFRLTRREDRRGSPRFALEVR
jgi:Uma2 family endonuclease